MIRPIRNRYHRTTSQKKIQDLPVSDQHVPFDPQSYKQMDQSKQHGIYQKFIGSLSGANQSAGTVICSPKNVLVTTSTTSPKISSKQDTPYNSGNTAEHEQLDRLVHSLVHPRELLEHYETGNRHDRAVSGIRKHHSKEKYIERTT